MLSTSSFKQAVLSARWYRSKLRILCACSGGVDSTVLLDLLHTIPEIEISIIHINHELRGQESLSDMYFVQDLAKKYQYPMVTVREDIRKYSLENHLSIEEAGSQRRKSILLEALKQLDYDLVATGQHWDDQTETILMNLYTGTGIRGLTGIGSSWRQIIRPLLSFSRSEIEAYAQLNNLEFCLDGTNLDKQYLRNNIRAELIPFLNRSTENEFRHLIHQIVERGNVLNELIDNSSEHYDNINIRRYSGTKISLGLDLLSDYFSPIQKTIFDRAFQAISSKTQGLSEVHFRELKALFAPDTIGKELELPASVVAYRDRNHITFLVKSACRWGSTKLSGISRVTFPFFHFDLQELRIHDHVKNPDYFWLNDTDEAYSLRMSRAGDRMVINGSGKRLTVNQILQEAHVAPSVKRFYPVLTWEDKLVWIPGIRTSFEALVALQNMRSDEVKRCIKVQFDEGTFE